MALRTGGDGVNSTFSTSHFSQRYFISDDRIQKIALRHPRIPEGSDECSRRICTPAGIVQYNIVEYSVREGFSILVDGLALGGILYCVQPVDLCIGINP